MDAALGRPLALTGRVGDNGAMAEDQWAHAATWGRSPRLNELETNMWRCERHPESSSLLSGICVLDRPPDWDRLVEGFGWATAMLPRLRERVVDPLLPLSTPAWSEDPAFELGYHVRRVMLPGEPGDEELLYFAENWVVRPLDRHRPLWELIVVEGLSGGRAAMIAKIHHVIADGTGLVQLLGMLMSHTREHNPDKPSRPPVPAGRETNPLRLTIDQMAEKAVTFPRSALRAAETGRRVVFSPVREGTRAVGYALSAARIVGTPKADHSPLLWPRTQREWRFATLECGQADLRAAARTVEASLNDALVAALLGGLRHYHLLHGVRLPELPMAMPVSTRRPGDPDGANTFAATMFTAPFDIEDPAARIMAVRAIVQRLRREPAVGIYAAITGPVNRLPSALGAAAVKAAAVADISVSNVAGPTWQPYFCGAKVLRYWPYGPLPGVAVMATMMTFAGTCCIGLNVDGSVVEDLDQLMDCMALGFDEVIALA